MAHTEEVIKKIAKDFKVNVKGNPAIRPLQKKLINKTATYLDADKYALEVAKALGKSLSDNLQWGALSEAEYKEVISQVLPAGLESTYETVSEYAGSVQRGLNEYSNIKLQVIKPEIKSEEILYITNKAVKSKQYTEVAGAINQEAMNFAQNVATKMMKENAGFQKNVGYDIRVVRKYDDIGLHRGTKYAEACEWCLEREGEWSYDEAKDKGVFERHPGCECIITYKAEKGWQLQTDWSNNTWVDVT